MTDALIAPTEFVGLETVAHLCAGGEAPVLRSHLDALATFAADKSAGMAGRDRMFEVYHSAKRHLAWLVNRPAGDIALLAHATEGVNVVANALDWRRGDNIVLADVEFPSMVYPWTRLQRLGVSIHVVKVRNWVVHLDDLREAVDERTRLVAISQVSYLTGQRVSLPAVANIAWQVGARLLVDATHALGAIPVDANFCDFMVSSCYKWLLAAHGTGVFVLNRARVPELVPPAVGWHSVSHGLNLDNPTEVVLRPDVERLETGNPSFPTVYMLNNALERLAAIPARAAEAHICELSSQLRRGLVERGRRVITPEPPNEHAGNICFLEPDAEALVSRLADRGVLVWGSEGRVRVSTHVYNSSGDLDRLFDSLDLN